EHTSELQSRRDLVCRLLLEKKSDVCSRSEEHTSELQSRRDLVCRLLLETHAACRLPRSRAGPRRRRRRGRRASARPASWTPRSFFNDTATPEIYTLSLHDALPI